MDKKKMKQNVAEANLAFLCAKSCGFEVSDMRSFIHGYNFAIDDKLQKAVQETKKILKGDF